MDIKLVVTLTKTGHTARLISKYRPNADKPFQFLNLPQL
ncbi:MAG: pyruvate kinase alpha/beta domain-containing protein [Leptotrichia wadei]